MLPKGTFGEGLFGYGPFGGIYTPRRTLMYVLPDEPMEISDEQLKVSSVFMAEVSDEVLKVSASASDVTVPEQ